MKKFKRIFIFLFFIVSVNAFSQIIWYGENISVYIKTGTNLVITGDIINSSNAKFDCSGSINLSGNWINNSGTTAFINSSPGSVILNGGNQIIGGSDSTVFFNLNLQGIGTKQLSVNSTVEGVLSLNDRELATQGFAINVTNANLNSLTRTSGFVSSTGNGCLSRVTLNNQPYLFPVGSSLGTFATGPLKLLLQLQPVIHILLEWQM